MIDLLKQLIRADSTLPSGERAAAEVLAAFFRRHGVETALDVWAGHRANVTARVRSSCRRPAMLFGAHLDVVPAGEGVWQSPPFDAVERDGRIYGRGAADMKGGLAAAAAAVVETVAAQTPLEGDLIFAATAGEETDSCGILRFVERNMGTLPPLAGVVICEPTNFSIVTAHRGMLWLKLTTHGRTAHSSMPHLGVNAVLKMHRLIERIQTLSLSHTPDPLLGSPSMSINQIHGGKANNVVPDECSINIDIRTVPGQDHGAVIREFQALIDALRGEDDEFRADVVTIRGVEPMRTDATCAFVREVCRATGIGDTVAVGYTTDGPYFGRLGAPVAVFGPGRSDVCHKPDEYIDIADIEKGSHLFRSIIRAFLA